jgi:enamine deaminase RidA (YjgF/YER057c/UK114 family)
MVDGRSAAYQINGMSDDCRKTFEAAGATLGDVVHRRAFLPDMDKYLAVRRDPDMAGRYRNRDKVPASTAVQVSRLSDRCFLIETDL